VDRREFLKTASAASAASAAWQAAANADQRPAPPGAAAPTDRDVWIAVMRRLADPVLTHLANGTLKARLPVEQAEGADRRNVTHLEALGRLMAGLAPWIELPADASPEGRLRADYATLAHRAIARAVDPASPDFLNFTRDRQPLVDAAFLAQGILRAPRTLRDGFDATTKRHLVAARESTRPIMPGFNNWLLFSAMVEAGLKSLGAGWDPTRVDYAVRQHEQWYKGDGADGDGPEFHWDFYNSFVIQPYLLQLMDTLGDQSPSWSAMRTPIHQRAQRYAAIQERLIAPDGSYPAIGRSITYRCGAFHLLADAARRNILPEGITPPQVRSALSAVMLRTLGPAGTFSSDGWLQIGLAGHQPGLGETYISTGSLYLCSAAWLPLGLPPADPFWSQPPQPWTSQIIWSGKNTQADHAHDES